MGKISALIMYSRGTVGISNPKQTWSGWYIVWNFGSVGNLKYFGVRLRNKDCRIKKLQEINLEKCSVQLQNVLPSFLLSDNITIGI